MCTCHVELWPIEARTLSLNLIFFVMNGPVLNRFVMNSDAIHHKKLILSCSSVISIMLIETIIVFRRTLNPKLTPWKIVRHDFCDEWGLHSSQKSLSPSSSNIFSTISIEFGWTLNPKLIQRHACEHFLWWIATLFITKKFYRFTPCSSHHAHPVHNRVSLNPKP